MVLRGYRKNLVIVKNIDGDIFDEALFLLRDGAVFDEDEIIKEADRIISNSRDIRALKNAKTRFSLPEFFIGIAAAAIIGVIVALIF